VSTERRDGSGSLTAVILDYGQVLARSPTVPEFERMAKMFNVNFEAFYRMWEQSRGPYDRGDLTAEEYWLRLAKLTDTRLDGSQIEILRKAEVEIWAHLDPEMIDWLSRLHRAGIKTALLSNMPCDLVTYVRTNCRWIENFSFMTFSAEVRLIKPDPAIYEHTLGGLGVGAAETVFVDDREVNIEAARTLGIRTILFRSIAQLKDELEDFGFPILPRITEAAPGGSEAAGRSPQPAQEIKFQL
jgi:putative hydrolase of the HAD superfamily